MGDIRITTKAGSYFLVTYGTQAKNITSIVGYGRVRSVCYESEITLLNASTACNIYVTPSCSLRSLVHVTALKVKVKGKVVPVL
jgi:hypothetical protein